MFINAINDYRFSYKYLIKLSKHIFLTYKWLGKWLKKIGGLKNKFKKK